MLIIESDSPLIVWFSVILYFILKVLYFSPKAFSSLKNLLSSPSSIKIGLCSRSSGDKKLSDTKLKKKTSPFFSPYQNLKESKLIYERSKILILYNNVRSYGNLIFEGRANPPIFTLRKKL